MRILKNKNAISPVVATILMVLITIAAVTIIWAVIMPMISDNVSNLGTGIPTLSIITGEGYTTYNSDEQLASVQIKREGSDEQDLAKIQVLFEIQGETTAYEVPAPNANGVRTYYFQLSGEPDKVSIAPIITKGSGTEALSVVSEAELDEGIMGVDDLPESVEVYEPVGTPREYTLGDVTGFSAVTVAYEGNWLNYASHRIWAYRTVQGTKFYSKYYISNYVYDPSGTVFGVNLTWNPVENADGYVISEAYSITYKDVGDVLNVMSTNFGWAEGTPTTTPSSPQTI